MIKTKFTTTTNLFKNKIFLFQVHQANALKRLFRRNQRLQQTGIAAMDQQISNNKEENEEQKILMNSVASRGDILRYGSDALIVRRRQKEDESEEEEDLRLCLIYRIRFSSLS